MIKKNLKVLQLFLLFPALAFFTSYCKKDDIPVEKEELSLPIVAIAAGFGHSLGLKTDGTLWVWGSNDAGVFGDGANVGKETPTLIGAGYSAIAAGWAYSIALKTDGTLWTWGDNYYGQLGDSTFVDKNIPVMIGPN